MQGGIKINGEECTGIYLMDNSASVLYSPIPMKGYVENSSRLEHGKHITVENPVFDSREINLVFGIKGDDSTVFKSRRDALISKLYNGEITLEIPQYGNEIFHLLYQKSVTYSQNRTCTFCKMSCKFVEPNPNNR